nr:PREDICTED: uncharacterized protein LOC105663561 [Megachile rotundata]
MSNGSYSAIDLTFCSPNIYDNIEYTTSTELYNSDHFPIFVEFIDNNTGIPIAQPTWKFKKADWILYQEEVNQNLPSLKAPNSTNSAGKSIPKTSNAIVKNNLPWWNNECHEAIKEKKYAFNVYKKHKTDINLIEFKRVRAKARKVLKQAKKDAWINYISSLTKNTPCDKMWNKLKKINGQKVNSQITAIKGIDNSIITDSIEMANLLATTFAKNSNLYNCIWLNGVFPDKWQEAIVVPILKPGKNKLQVDSYRPIALTCCLCKLLEKILCKRLRWYLVVNNLLERNQNGFRQHCSTIDSLTMLDTNICEAFLKKRHLVAICLDIEKAYDMVWRHRIIQQLQKWNINDPYTSVSTEIYPKKRKSETGYPRDLY